MHQSELLYLSCHEKRRGFWHLVVKIQWLHFYGNNLWCHDWSGSTSFCFEIRMGYQFYKNRFGRQFYSKTFCGVLVWSRLPFTMSCSCKSQLLKNPCCTFQRKIVRARFWQTHDHLLFRISYQHSSSVLHVKDWKTWILKISPLQNVVNSKPQNLQMHYVPSWSSYN